MLHIYSRVSLDASIIVDVTPVGRDLTACFLMESMMQTRTHALSDSPFSYMGQDPFIFHWFSTFLLLHCLDKNQFSAHAKYCQVG